MRCSVSVSLPAYNECVRNGGDIAFVCDNCSFSSLPFYNNSIDNDDARVAASASSSSSPLASSSSSSPLASSSPVSSVLLAKGIHFIHSKVRSLLPKIADIRLFLARTKTTVFAASETWLDSTVSDNEIHIPGFNVIRSDRNRNGGGVALFIRENVAFNPRPDIAVDGLEATWVELLPPKTKGILVCCIYRPPNDSSFINKLELALSKLDPSTEVYILGDMNIDFREKNTTLLNRYKDVLNFFGFDQLVAELTRMTPTSASLIDHILTNVSEVIQTRGVIVGGFSDHCITFCSRRCIKGFSVGSNIKKIRSFKNYSKAFFNSELAKVDWSNVLSSVDVNFCLSEFCRIFMSVIDVVAPFKEVRVRDKPNPWINTEILASIRKQNALFCRFKKRRKDPVLYKEYCKARNAVQRDVKLAKETFFKQGVERNSGDSGKLWRHLSSLGYSKKSASSSSGIVLENDGSKVFDAAGVASLFNRFYTTVAADLVSKLPNPNGIY